jgi:hypothetical protein
VELTLPPPPDDTPPDGAWSPLFDELLLDPLLLDPSDELPDDPLDPLELVPELDVDPVDELELEEDLLPVLVAAWLAPGSITATTPATATLARDTVVVVAFSRRRPCSRSTTARATCRATCRAGSRLASPRFAGRGARSSQLFTSTSVTRPAVCAVVERSANVLSARAGEYPRRAVA